MQISNLNNYSDFIADQKWLQSIKSSDGTTDFNPYALKFGDIIRVHILATQIKGAVEIKDDIFQSTNTAIGTSVCQPINNSFMLDGQAGGSINPANSNQIIWSYVGAKTEVEFSYECQVK